MKKTTQVRNKATLLLISAILLLCVGFIFTACGVGPAQKAVNTILGNFALDFTVCPGSDNCIVAFTSVFPNQETGKWTKFEGKPLTFEAWVKPKATSTGTILQRFSDARGAKLTYSGVDADEVKPKFTIRRVVESANGVSSSDYPYPTSTATYEVSAATDIFLDAWTHVAGILVHNEDTAATTAHVDYHAAEDVSCAGTPGNFGATPAGVVADDSDGIAEDDEWHLDIYIDGELDNCSYAYGEETAHGNNPDPTTAVIAYAHEPAAHTSGPGRFFGVIDEARVWNVEKTETTLAACMNQELANGGTCDLGSNDLITYHTFNAGTGHTVYDRSGELGAGGKEYSIGGGNFEDWNTGWTDTDTPF